MNIFDPALDPDTDSDILIDEDNEKSASVVVYNDDYNSFEWVISTFQQHCGHTAEQAEQCAMIIHTKGKCAVKTGSKESMNAVCEALCNNGLSAVVEDNE